MANSKAKQEYRNARRAVRGNGTYALRWLVGSAYRTMQHLASQKPDYLQERAAVQRSIGVSSDTAARTAALMCSAPEHVYAAWSAQRVK